MRITAPPAAYSGAVVKAARRIGRVPRIAASGRARELDLGSDRRDRGELRHRARIGRAGAGDQHHVALLQTGGRADVQVVAGSGEAAASAAPARCRAPNRRRTRCTLSGPAPPSDDLHGCHRRSVGGRSAVVVQIQRAARELRGVHQAHARIAQVALQQVAGHHAAVHRGVAGHRRGALSSRRRTAIRTPPAPPAGRP